MDWDFYETMLPAIGPVVTEPTSSVHLLILCGNIASGLSSTIRNFEACISRDDILSVQYMGPITEPVDAYAKYVTKIPLDNKEHPLFFPFLSRVQSHYADICGDIFRERISSDGKTIFIMERSPLDSVEVFLKTVEASLSSTEVFALRNAGRCLWNAMCRMVNKITMIYVDCPPDECYRRIKNPHYVSTEWQGGMLDRATVDATCKYHEKIPESHLLKMDVMYKQFVHQMEDIAKLSTDENFRVARLACKGKKPYVIMREALRYAGAFDREDAKCTIS